MKQNKKYRELRVQLSFNSEVDGYIYNEEIGPAAILFNILGSNGNLYKYININRPNNKKLKLWMPDTLMYFIIIIILDFEMVKILFGFIVI